VTQNIAIVLVAIALLAACSDGTDRALTEPVYLPIPPDEESVFAAAHRCVTVSAGERFLGQASEQEYQWQVDAEGASRFRLQPADLGIYLLYDEYGHYLVSSDMTLARQAALSSDVRREDGEIIIEDRRQSEGEWQLTAAQNGQFRLHHLRSGTWLTQTGPGDASEAIDLSFTEADNCADFPELSLDANGRVQVTRFEDGDLFGFVETHSHLLTNFAFGGGGVFHGAPFHRLGVEHALPNCELSHGEDGRRDILGAGDNGNTDIQEILPALVSGILPEKSHNTDGYPTFSDWPDAPRSATHQVQYYKWLERAWLSGLRLLVQHATTSEVQCELVTGIGSQPQRLDCNDMVAVDRIIEETYAMERYIDAQSGGPGRGWFRIVFDPQQAREEIAQGNLAVVLGIETTDLFNCFLTPQDDFQRCTQGDVVSKLDDYHARGVRVMFPVHKFDNGFSAGDGHRQIILELGQFVHTGHYGHLSPCPDELLEFDGGFDSGPPAIPNLQQPRLSYLEPPVVDTSGFPQDPVGTLLPFLGLLAGEPETQEYCQSFGLTDLGESLMLEMMQRGMIIEVDHFPRRSYARAFELLEANDYPAVGSHGRNFNGRLYSLGGVSKMNLGRCRTPGESGATIEGLRARVTLMEEQGAYPAEGFGFDFNGFAGSPGPRFGPHSVCAGPQTDEGITYPFTSFAGDVEFTQPVVGERQLNFNTEGMSHLGLVAELIEDVRRDGVSDADLEPLFRSAEGYVRMWEKAIARSKDLQRAD